MVDDVRVANRRLDASENEALIGIARMGADAFGYTAELIWTVVCQVGSSECPA